MQQNADISCKLLKNNPFAYENDDNLHQVIAIKSSPNVAQ